MSAKLIKQGSRVYGFSVEGTLSGSDFVADRVDLSRDGTRMTLTRGSHVVELEAQGNAIYLTADGRRQVYADSRGLYARVPPV